MHKLHFCPICTKSNDIRRDSCRDTHCSSETRAVGPTATVSVSAYIKIHVPNHLTFQSFMRMTGSFAKQLYRALGLERWILSNEEEIEAISKARHDKSPCDLTSNQSKAVKPDYNTWLNEHPCALSCFEDMMSLAKGKKIVVFLDYDGTLSPIVNDPDSAFMSGQMRSAVRKVAKLFPTAIISGRSRDKVYNFVKLDEVYYAGSHGMDIRGPPRQLKSSKAEYQRNSFNKKENEIVIFQPAKEFLPAIEEMLNVLEEETSVIKGVLIEDNRFCISVHYRHVQSEDFSDLLAKVQSVLSNYSNFHMTRGKKVLEIRPSIKWNKGNALEYLLDTLGFASSNDDVLPIYIGDDRTDEDAFKVIRSRGVGYPIIVSSTPRETVASYSLRDPSEVMSFLLCLARSIDNKCVIS